jgi:hypothetical protein
MKKEIEDLGIICPLKFADKNMADESYHCELRNCALWDSDLSICSITSIARCLLGFYKMKYPAQAITDGLL